MQAGAWRPSSRTVLVFVICCAIGVVYGYVATAHGLWIPPLGWLFVGYAIGVVCHELGHALCAAIGSIPVRRIQIGVGPILLRHRFREVSLELRLFPLSGFVATYPVANFRRAHWALFTLGGVLGNAAVIAVVAGLASIGAVPKQADNFLGGIIFAQAIIIAATIIPSKYTVSGNRVASDGLQILQLLWQRRDPRAEPEALYADLLSGYSNNSGSPPPTMSLAAARVMYHLYRADRWTDEEARRDFREALLRELERGELSHEEQMLVLDALASDGLAFGDPELRSHLDAWSLRALKLGPGMIPLLSTRGAVLVELGHHEEGKALLAPIATADHIQKLDSLVSQVFLARAEHALGNAAAARQFADAARTTAEAEPDSPVVVLLLARLEPELAIVP
jgi:hypothetical protein